MSITLRIIYVCLIFLASNYCHVKSIHLNTFGAIPNDGKSDALAFEKPLVKIGGYKGRVCTLVLDPGVYDLYKIGDSFQIAPFKKIDNLTLSGEGITLVMDGIANLFSFTDCNNISIHHFNIDGFDLPYSIGTVINNWFDYFDLKVTSPHFARNVLPTQAVNSYDTVLNIIGNQAIDYYQEPVKSKLSEILANGLQRICESNPKGLPKRGQTVLVRHEFYDNNAF
jgi:hypothetical protein